uniref:Uncharacterized protein n=1 Tax=Lepeophtheirus salmonis TaxID=72036 RepID=A0A0K2U410_LEPSM
MTDTADTRHVTKMFSRGWHQGCRRAKSVKKSSKELKRLIQKSLETEEIGFFNFWCQPTLTSLFHTFLIAFCTVWCETTDISCMGPHRP